MKSSVEFLAVRYTDKNSDYDGAANNCTLDNSYIVGIFSLSNTEELNQAKAIVGRNTSIRRATELPLAAILTVKIPLQLTHFPRKLNNGMRWREPCSDPYDCMTAAEFPVMIQCPMHPLIDLEILHPDWLDDHRFAVYLSCLSYSKEIWNAISKLNRLSQSTAHAHLSRLMSDLRLQLTRSSSSCLTRAAFFESAIGTTQAVRQYASEINGACNEADSRIGKELDNLAQTSLNALTISSDYMILDSVLTMLSRCTVACRA